MGVAAGTQTFLNGKKHVCPWEPPCLWERVVTSQPKPSTHRLWIGKRPQSVIVFLPCCIPEAQVHWLSIYHYIGRIIIKPANEESPSVTILWSPSHLYMEFKGAVNQERILQHSSSGNNLPSSCTQPKHHPYLSSPQSDLQQPLLHIQTKLLHTQAYRSKSNWSPGTLLTRWECILQERHLWCNWSASRSSLQPCRGKEWQA